MPTLVITRDKTYLEAPDGITGMLRKNRNAIATSLSFRRDGYFFSEAYQGARWDGRVNLYHKRKVKKDGKNTYPGDGDWYRTGLLQLNLKTWQRYGVEIRDERELPEIEIDDTLDSYQDLRPFQQQAVRAILENMVGGIRLPRGIIHLPPRTGKTRIAAALLDQLATSRPAIFVVERIDLARQSVAAFKEVLDEDIGLVGDGEIDVKDITVATIQSLHQAFKLKYDKKHKSEYIEKRIINRQSVVELVTTCEVLIIDEGHHSAARGYQTTMGKARNAWCIVGLSGTPWLDDKADLLLTNAIGPVLYRKSYTYMVGNHYLVPLTIYLYMLPKVICYSGNYGSVYKTAVTDNLIKEYLIVGAAKALIRKGRSVAILTVQIAHAKRLAKLIPGAVVITGKERGIKRVEAYNRLNRKRIKCIVSTVFSEGIDVPTLDAGINADGGRDSRKIFQRLRMMTPAPGKKGGIYIDFLHQEKHLKAHSDRRHRFYKNEEAFKVIVRDLRTDLRMRFRTKVPVE